MQEDIACSLRGYLYHLQSAPFQAVRDRRREPGPIGHLRETAAVALDEGPEVEPMRRAEEQLEVEIKIGGARVCRGQERKDAAAVVVDEHHHQIERVLSRGQK